MARCWTGPPKVPTFNLTVNVWFSNLVTPPVGAPNLVTVGQLQLGERNPIANVIPVIHVYLLVPKLTDINAGPRTVLNPNPDLVECPGGSGRWYQVSWVDDVGKGFANEYRQVWMYKTGQWPVPIP